MRKEKEIFRAFLRKKGLKLTRQREGILDVFLGIEKHVSVEDLYALVRTTYPTVGHTTVFRTLKLLSFAGLAREVNLGDKIVRFEHAFNHTHHDHLICIECARFIEAVDPRIENLQGELCARFDFSPMRHRLEIFGMCKTCRKRKDMGFSKQKKLCEY